MDIYRSSDRGLGRTERQRLVRALDKVDDARHYRRLQALLEVADGEPVAAVARRLRVERSTVHRWLARYRAERQPERLRDAQRTGRPRAGVQLTDARLKQLLTSEPCACGYDANNWTVALLAAHLRDQGIAISARTLRRRIRAARFRWKRPRYVYSERADHVGAKKGGIVRRLKRALGPNDVLLFTDWTLLRLFPPLRAMWAQIGTQAEVKITGQNAKRVLFGTINVRTARRTVHIGAAAGAREVAVFLLALRKTYRRAGTIWLLADRASGHTARTTLDLACRLKIEFIWLPKQWPELNAMDQLWKALKQEVAANRQAASIDELAARAASWVLALTPTQARRKSGMASDHFWLQHLLQHFWLPT